MTSAAGSSSSPLAARRRRDIEIAAQYYERQRVWALKDPIGLRYFHLNDEEFWLLERLDGRTSIVELQREFERRFPSRRLDVGMLQSFVSQLHHEGLIVIDTAGQGEVLFRRRANLIRDRRLVALQRPYAIRLRGIDPEPLLQWAAPFLKKVCSATSLVVAAVLVVVAAMVFIVHSRTFFQEASALGDFFQLRNALMIALIVGGTRLLHEAGHAAVCKRLGGECHEIGFMLFLLAPSAYCDVSSSWMIPNKWSRMAVSAAGIGVELVLASVAVLLWRFSEPGGFHELCLLTATICSVNTLLLNGNPLMRYDGYHVLADWLEMPDLARRADGVWRRWAARLWYGEEAAAGMIDTLEPEPSWGRDLALAAYAVAAKAYLIFVIVVGLMLFQRWANLNHLHALGAVMSAAIVVGMTVTPAIRAARRWNAPRGRESQRGARFWGMTLLAAAILIAVLLVPLPRSIDVPATLRPTEVATVYVTQPGFLQSIVTDRTVAQGDVVAVLHDDDLHREVLRLKDERDQAALVVQNLERRQSLVGGSSLDLPTARQALRDVEQRLQRRTEDEGRLMLRAPSAGRVMAAPRRPAAEGDPRSLKHWSGSLADDENRGAYLEPGVLVAEVGDPNHCEAVAVVGQADVLFVRPGAKVELLTDVATNRRATGRVTEVGRTTVRSQQARQEGSAGAAESQPIEYQVRIAIDGSVDGVTLDGPIRVKIAAPSESLGAKLLRVLAQTFRFN